MTISGRHLYAEASLDIDPKDPATGRADYSGASGPTYVIAEDFSSDGILDLAVANETSGSASIFQGQGTCLPSP